MMRHFHQQFVKIHAYMHFLVAAATPPSALSLHLWLVRLSAPWRYFINLLSRLATLQGGGEGALNEWQTKPGDDNTNRM